jgi:L-fucose isomerase-like protein
VKLGVVAIARPTFDVPFAESTAQRAFDTLTMSGIDVVGSPDLMMSLPDVTDAVRRLAALDIDALVVLQASFADSTLIVGATDVNLPIVLWAFPEERTGGRLRLNSFCGINLGGFALARLVQPYEWILASADDVSAAPVISRLVEHPTERRSLTTPDDAGGPHTDESIEAARHVRDRLAKTTIGRVGERPEGFEPCAYEAEALRSILGVVVDEVPLPELFARASKAGDSDVARARTRASSFLAGVDAVDQSSLDKSLRLNVGLQSLIRDGGWAGVATRCWPETFTEFGGAACTPMALLAEDGTPGSCEADIYGNITGLVLSWLGQSASFVADLVDLDVDSDTGVLWHCGLAPFEMADPVAEATATIHSNRQKPLLSEFPLKPGRVTIARFSQSRGVHRLVIGAGEMLRAPLAFSGTAGVIRFDNPVPEVLATIMSEGLEHHYGIVYADVVRELRALAWLLELPVVEL